MIENFQKKAGSFKYVQRKTTGGKTGPEISRL